jgi:phosphatidate cytidylyltransferase
MRTRILTALVALCVLIPVLLLSHTWLFPVMVAVCCLIALWEIFKCIGVQKNLWITVPLYLSAVFVIMTFRLFRQLFDYRMESFVVRVAVPCMMLVILYLFAVLVFSRGKILVESVAVAGFMSLYIIAAFMALLFLRDSQSGAYTYLLIFIGAWVTDSFAYFTGILFGKHKLIPEISPKKTIEGSIGGTLFCGGAFMLYGVAIAHFVESASRMNLALLFVYGIVVSVVSQVGDLSLSAVKRHYGIKDFGKIFPGHGGILDRFDSILAVSLVLFVLNEFASIFR